MIQSRLIAVLSGEAQTVPFFCEIDRDRIATPGGRTDVRLRSRSSSGVAMRPDENEPSGKRDGGLPMAPEPRASAPGYTEDLRPSHPFAYSGDRFQRNPTQPDSVSPNEAKSGASRFPEGRQLASESFPERSQFGRIRSPRTKPIRPDSVSPNEANSAGRIALRNPTPGVPGGEPDGRFAGRAHSGQPSTLTKPAVCAGREFVRILVALNRGGRTDPARHQDFRDAQARFDPAR